MMPVHYEASGEGPAVVFLHGMAASLRDWKPFFPALADAGWRACAMDLLGHGGSAHPSPASAYSADAVYRHFCSWLDAMQLDQPLVLVGHSFGGYLSLMHALNKPQSVRALILIDPFYSPRQLAFYLRIFHRRGRIAAAALRYTPARLMSMALGFTPNHSSFPRQARSQIALDVKRASPQIMHIPGSMVDLTPRLSQVAQPALVIWGARDPTLSPASFQTLVAHLPNAQCQALDHCFHQPHISAQKQVEGLVLDFLETI